MIHEPRCADWREHVQKAVAEALDSEDWPTIWDFSEELRASWADEQLLSDPEAPRVYAPAKWSDIRAAKGGAAYDAAKT